MTAFLCGCATAKLWEADHFSWFGEPAPDARLRLFQSDQNQEVVVEYDELTPGQGAIRRRAYFLQENDARVRALKKPKFLTRPATDGLKSIELLQEPKPGTEPLNYLYAVASTNGHKFSLFGPDNRFGSSYELPTYRTSSGRLIQVLLTPPALIVDATIVGGVLLVIFWPTGLDFEVGLGQRQPISISRTDPSDGAVKSSLRPPYPGATLATRSDGLMECWSDENPNTPPLHHSVWDHADSVEMTNRRTDQVFGVLSPRPARSGYLRGVSLRNYHRSRVAVSRG